jgi:hypothetical protein
MSTKRLRSVIQSTAHHAVSGPCYVHPNLGAVCKGLDLESVQVSLLAANFVPALGKIPKELSFSTIALREKYLEILASEHISLNEAQEAYATFEFLQAKWPVGSDGDPAEVLRRQSKQGN